ncbi:MAG: LamG domain-containing protein [Bryobacteraceae bacterium]|nr:LamG domain-containing protein [Bryobacteraceae bacterium]MDW8378434.1 LamG-like jellyroll fold domain-containing protein [Bryobacterales bacterium]
MMAACFTRAILGPLLAGALRLTAAGAQPATVALWLFDEPSAAPPSSILNDAAGGYILALGRGAKMAVGKFGNSLEICEPLPLQIRGAGLEEEEGGGSVLFGIRPLPVPKGRSVEPLSWRTANFAALATSGERHLRSPGFPNVSGSKLTLGDFNWTLEFWYLPLRVSREEGVVYEIGSGPRGENDRYKRLVLAPDQASFRLYEGGSQPVVVLSSDASRLRPGAGAWVHLAFTYDAAQKLLRHFVNGVPQPAPPPVALRPLPAGDEAYLTLGRDGQWLRPLPGRVDEMRISDQVLYRGSFTPPSSFSLTYSGRLPELQLQKGLPLLFGAGSLDQRVIPLLSRKHLFLDDALIERMKGIQFVVNPPVRKEKVFENLRGHLSMVEDEQGRIRIYYREKNDWLGVVWSANGVDFEKPDLGREHGGMRNIVLAEAVGLGNVFLDPNAPAENRWRYFSGIRRRSMFVYTSRDGWSFQRHETAALPFAAGSQSIVYYDEQRQLYAGHHRSDYGMTETGKTQRVFLLSETRDLFRPWPFFEASDERVRQEARRRRTKASRLDPWFVDNGPLSPPGLSVELPVVFSTSDELDPPSTDIYTTKVMKYPWAPDAYFCFPSVYFHYEGAQPPARATLAEPRRKKGSGVVEVQLAVSRDGIHWKRLPRPAYIPINSNGEDAIHMMFLTHGMVRRGNEIWQYAGGHAGNGVNYHSAWVKQPNSPLWRYVQRFDGFVAAEAAYTGGEILTRPLRFEGKHLRLNIDTGAVGFAQVGILDEQGKPLDGYGVEECVYINGDFLKHPVEWMSKGTDVSELAGRSVRLYFRMRGARLYAMQFTPD